MNTNPFPGWSTDAGWNVSNWIVSDTRFHTVARLCANYEQFVQVMGEVGVKTTPDGIRWDDDSIDHRQMDSFLTEL